MHKKIIIPIIILIALLLIIFLPIILNKKPVVTEKIETKEEIKKSIEELNNVIINGGSKTELIKILGTKDIQKTDIMTGPDSYVRTKPEKAIQNKLKDYMVKNEEIAKNLDKKIKENFEYEIHDPIKSKKSVSVAISYKTYYYQYYLRDLQKLYSSILIKAGYDLSKEPEMTNEIKIDMYKAKIKAMTILDKNLDTYVNQNEIKTIGINYIDGQMDKSSNALVSYLMNLNGYSYDYQNSELFKNSEARINKYLEEIDSNNPLKL